jgi:hypothetical protein
MARAFACGALTRRRVRSSAEEMIVYNTDVAQRQWLGAEHLGVDVIWRDAQRRKAAGQIAHEGFRSADIEVTVAWHVEHLKLAEIQNPRQAGGGPDAAASPGFPVAGPSLRSCSSSASKELRQPPLNAGMRSSRRSRG